MGKIHELDNVLANQIAAGEVIERPASIVKELVENSLDAHSHRIDIIVENAGLDSVRVIDDGDGIAKEDVAVAFRRHATSKISSQHDLFKVQTMGFRGEALPSIASVADVTLTTAQAEQNEGTMIHIRGGKTLVTKPAPARQGTDIKVTDLFFNTPARLKYLKSPQTELARITDIVNRLALANPAVAFSFTHNGRELFRSAGNDNLQQVVAAIYGVKAGRKMLAIQGEDNDFRINGYVSLPELTRASRQYITITINHRYIRNFELTKAIIQGYESKLMVGRYPLAVVNIDLDPVLVDVNVHPAKREVRLSKEQQLTHLLSQTIRKRISVENLIPEVDANQFIPNEDDIANLDRRLKEAAPTYHAAPESAVAAKEEVAANNNNLGAQSPAQADANDSELVAPIVIHDVTDLNNSLMQEFDKRYQNESGVSLFSTEPASTGKVKKAKNIELDVHDKSDKATRRFPELQYIGQLQGTFLLAQAGDGLYIVDQHAAQERINYEYYRKKIGEVSADQQNFLVPLVLNYSTVDALTITQHLDILTAVGINLEPFGQNSFILRSHPTWFKEGQEEDTAKEMIDWLIKNGKLTVREFRMKTAIMMSCKRAIKANHHLDQREAKALLARLPQCENPFNCPHGRPVTVHFNDQDLEKMFKRIQDSHEPYADDFDDHDF
ncbi:DNA mismatch repair endonuclease MutL [Limosilactobacillus sp. STM2_1]|uniref:DNA mismatch repair protein MutL n=1 Tax=Limosilactobacillus rudii TaxID=2759755 RepID=A0A7W3ULT1_9LACO|nr:DNA mismatch repair endonuclease MutL [Limosilactobacillus rudii]MBB1079870.1 DNA mismatch repair endonuclease MutL [Limosilactobacillus rudii]MBB1097948.1 DNA mismatch repair endonuclease MutL [Limosilactobacillus rudii]MCD7135017.1 DNA mismatch repair endonuclease MutL [Limosilactobacillus rudii]